MRRLILPLIAVLMLVIGGGGGYFLGNYLHPPKVVPAPVDDQKAHKAFEPPEADLLYDIPDMLVALPGSDNNDRFLAISVTVQCPTQADIDKLKEYLPRILDAFQAYLRTLSIADLRGTRNLAMIRSKLMEHGNAVIAPGQISAVLIRQLVLR